MGTKVFACKGHPLRTPLSQGLLRGDSDLPVSPHPHMGITKGSFPGGCSGDDAYLPYCKVVSHQGVGRRGGGGGTKKKPGLGWRRLKGDFKKSFGKIVANYLSMLLCEGLFHRGL